MTLFGFLALFVIVGSAALMFAGAKALRPLPSRTRMLVTGLAVLSYAAVLFWKPDLWFVSDTAVLAAGLTIGMLIGSSLGSGGAIVTFCVTVAIVDTVSFSGGFTKVIIESYAAGESHALIFLTIAVPFEGAVRPIIGIGDLVILTALFSGFSRVGHGGWQPFVVPVAGLLLALGLGLVVGFVPAMPFISATTIAYMLWWMKRNPVRSKSTHAASENSSMKGTS